MSGVKKVFVWLSHVTSFLLDNLSELKKYIYPGLILDIWKGFEYVVQ